MRKSRKKSGKSRARRRTNLRGLGSQVCFNTKKRGRVCFKAKKGVGGLRGLRDAATWAENKTKGCLKANLKLKKGWKFISGGRCVPSGYFSTGSKLPKTAKGPSKYPCMRKSGPMKGKLMKGWYIRGGKCIKAGSKPGSGSTLVRIPGSGGYVNGLRGLAGKAKPRRLSCQNKKTGHAKKGWRVKGRRCIPAKKSR